MNAPMSSAPLTGGLGRRGFLGLSAAAIGTMALSACGALGSADDGGSGSKTIGFALASFTVPRYVKLDLPNFKTAASDAGFKTVSVQADSDIDQQLEDVTNLLSQNLGALALQPVDSNAGVSMVKKAKAAGVPVLAYNQTVPSGDLSGFVSRDNKEAGASMVEAVQAKLGTLKGNVIICSGQPGDQVAIDITAGYMELLQPAIDAGDVKVLSQKYHQGWDPESARKQVEDSLTAAKNDVVAILCNNDGMAGGAIQALQAQGLDKKVLVTGLDATSEGCNAIVLGQQLMSVFTPFDEMGKTAGELCVKLANGEKLTSDQTFDTGDGEVPWFPVANQTITIDNVVEFVKKYSPDYVDAKIAFGNIPADQLPPGAADLL